MKKIIRPNKAHFVCNDERLWGQFKIKMLGKTMVESSLMGLLSRCMSDDAIQYHKLIWKLHVCNLKLYIDDKTKEVTTQS